MERDKTDKMIEFLRENNSERLNGYIEGYYSASVLAKEAGIERVMLYYAADILVPGATEIRKKKRQERIKYIEDAILNIVPYEYMEFDAKGLFGIEKYKKNRPISKSKMDINIILKQNHSDLSGFKFISFKKFVTMYKKYLISKELAEKTDKKGAEIARRYNMSTNKFYIFKEYYEENNGKIFSDMNEAQESLFKKNTEMYQDYKANNLSINEVVEKYDIKEHFAKLLINAYQDADEIVYKNKK